jgi:hypothetical protein
MDWQNQHYKNVYTHKQINDLIKKLAIELNKTFSKEEVQVA